MTGYLKIGQAAKFLGVSIGALRLWEKTKKIECFRDPLSKYRLYKISVLQKLKDSRKKKYNKTAK